MNEQQQPITKKRLTSAWISTVLSISLVLIMIGLLGIILINARRITNETKENIDFEVILQNDDFQNRDALIRQFEAEKAQISASVENKWDEPRVAIGNAV